MAAGDAAPCPTSSCSSTASGASRPGSSVDADPGEARPGRCAPGRGGRALRAGRCRRRRRRGSPGALLGQPDKAADLVTPPRHLQPTTGSPRTTPRSCPWPFRTGWPTPRPRWLGRGRPAPTTCSSLDGPLSGRQHGVARRRQGQDPPRRLPARGSPSVGAAALSPGQRTPVFRLGGRPRRPGTSACPRRPTTAGPAWCAARPGRASAAPSSSPWPTGHRRPCPATPARLTRTPGAPEPLPDRRAGEGAQAPPRRCPTLVPGPPGDRPPARRLSPRQGSVGAAAAGARPWRSGGR